jgi:hypothetical protein
MPSLHQPEAPEAGDHVDLVAAVVGILATGLRRALARPHDWNESVHLGDPVPGVALEDQSVISAVAPARGAKETA